MIKRLLLCLMASCSFIFVANAQFGVTAGFNSSSIVNDNYDGLSGFNVGIKGEGVIGDSSVFVEGSLLLSNKGYSWTPTFSAAGRTIKCDKQSVRLYYMHIPVYLGYKFHITDGFDLAPKAGVYLAYGLWGDDGDNDPFCQYHETFQWKNFERFDMGVNVGVNVNVMRHYQVSVGYEWGQIGLSEEVANDRLRNFYANLAYLF